MKKGDSVYFKMSTRSPIMIGIVNGCIHNNNVRLVTPTRTKKGHHLKAIQKNQVLIDRRLVWSK